MKNLLLIIICLFVQNQAFTQMKAQMKTQFITTSIGEIAVHIKTVKNTTPILLLHGVYYDYQLWNTQIEAINNRTIIAIDMPLHGESKRNIKQNWTLDDCTAMVIELLDSLQIERTIAIGHSWGSMTLLRAAAKYPQRFQALGLCNMPIEKPTEKQNQQFKLAHNFLIFRNFYTKQAAKSIIAKSSLKADEGLFAYLKKSMSKLSKADIKATDYAVIINSNDAGKLTENLTVPTLALKGESDYVPIAKAFQTEIVKGGHSSPIEDSKAVNLFIKKVIALQ